MDYQNPRKTLTSEQKTGFVLLLIFGILAVSLGALQIRNNIFNPFSVNLTKEDLETTKLFTDENARLQSIDTDQDGLNDYEELNFYETSPYLPDTDSDGIKDKTEIEDGTNPSCPEGESCDSLTLVSIATSTDIMLETLEGNSSSSLISDITEGNTDFLSDSNIEENVKIWLNDPVKLREFLLDSGSVSKEQISSVDDQTLLSVFKEVLIEKGGSKYLIGDGIESATTTNIKL